MPFWESWNILGCSELVGVPWDTLGFPEMIFCGTLGDYAVLWNILEYHYVLTQRTLVYLEIPWCTQGYPCRVHTRSVRGPFFSDRLKSFGSSKTLTIDPKTTLS